MDAKVTTVPDVPMSRSGNLQVVAVIFRDAASIRLVKQNAIPVRKTHSTPLEVYNYHANSRSLLRTMIDRCRSSGSLGHSHLPAQ